jgi:hypothetical protein
VQRWEYMVWQVDLQDRGGRVLDSIEPVDPHDSRPKPSHILAGLAQGIGGPIAPALKHFGEQGWELTGIDTSSTSCALYILRRSLKAPPTPWWRRWFEP